MTYKVLENRPTLDNYLLKKRTVSPWPLPAYYGSWSTISQSIVEKTTILRTVDGTRTPNYKRVKILPVNPYTGKHQRIERPYGVWTGRKSGSGYNYTEYYLEGTPPVSAVSLGDAPLATQYDELDLVLKIGTKVLNKVKKQHVNLAIAFAERKKTASTIAVAATRLYNAYKAAKRGRWSEAAETLGIHLNAKDLLKLQSMSLAKGWLEIQYGWKPLLSDVQGSVETLSRVFNDVAVHPEKASSMLMSAAEEITRIPGFSNTSFKTRKRTIRIKMYVYFEITSIVSSTLSQFGITNIASVAWEVVPYSFVADWFVKIGDYVNTIDATLGVKFSRGGYTVYDEEYCRVDFSTDGGVVGLDGIAWEGSGSGFKRLITVKRSVLTDFPYAGIPQFESPFSLSHMLSALSLIRVQFRR